MATVVDSLVVTLGLDLEKFKAGVQEGERNMRRLEGESTRVAKSMSAQGDNLADFFRKAKIEALALYGVIAGTTGVSKQLYDTAAGLNAVNRAAIASGESVRYVQAFSAAIGRTGGNVETARNQLTQFAATVEEFRLRGGMPGLAQYSQVLGINANTAKPQEIIEGIMRAIERNPGPQGRQYILNMGAQLGVPNDLMLSLLQMGTLAKLQAEIQHSVELGAVQSQKQIDAAIKFQGAVNEFRQAIEGFVTAAIPFKAMAEAISKFTEEMIHPPRPATPGEIKRKLTDPNYYKQPDDGLTPWQRLRRLWSGGGSQESPASGGGGLTDAQRTWANAIAGGEASGYNIRYGERAGQGSLDLAGPHPGPNKQGYSAAGRYQFLQSTWMEGINALGLPNVMSPENQDAVFAYLLRKHGVTDAMMADPSQRGEVLNRLRGEWPSLPGGSQQNTSMDQLNRRLNGIGPRAMLRPQDMMQPGAAPSVGSTNSNETHIGAVNVYPPNGDSKSIAQSIKQAIAREILDTANTGMA